jgi:hypothetical protein
MSAPTLPELRPWSQRSTPVPTLRHQLGPCESPTHAAVGTGGGGGVLAARAGIAARGVTGQRRELQRPARTRDVRDITSRLPIHRTRSRRPRRPVGRGAGEAGPRPGSAIRSVEREQLGWEWPEVPQVGSPYAHPTGAGASEDSTLVDFSHR